MSNPTDRPTGDIVLTVEIDPASIPASARRNLEANAILAGRTTPELLAKLFTKKLGGVFKITPHLPPPTAFNYRPQP